MDGRSYRAQVDGRGRSWTPRTALFADMHSSASHGEAQARLLPQRPGPRGFGHAHGRDGAGAPLRRPCTQGVFGGRRCHRAGQARTADGGVGQYAQLCDSAGSVLVTGHGQHLAGSAFTGGDEDR